MSNYNPYTPPQHDDLERLLLPGRASWDGTQLIIPRQFSFPRVCLKCGSEAVNTRRTQRFAYTPMWARLLVLVCWPGAVVAMALTTKRITLELPLCDPCHARWQKARNLSIGMVIGLVVIILGSVFVTGGSRSEGAALVLPLLIILLVVGFALGMSKVIRPNVLQAKKIDDESVTLLGVHPAAGELVARVSR